MFVERIEFKNKNKIWKKFKCEENLCCKYSSIDYSLFDFEIYFQDLSDLLCIVHAG